jgi:hypothetical protein
MLALVFLLLWPHAAYYLRILVRWVPSWPPYLISEVLFSLAAIGFIWTDCGLGWIPMWIKILFTIFWSAVNVASVVGGQARPDSRCEQTTLAPLRPGPLGT